MPINPLHGAKSVARLHSLRIVVTVERCIVVDNYAYDGAELDLCVGAGLLAKAVFQC